MRSLPLVAVLVAIPALSSAHEFWIAPLEWHVAQGAQISADLRNGEEFKGSSLAWLDRNIARAEIAQSGDVTPMTGRLGDRPALSAVAGDDGLAVLIHETTPSRLTYKDWAKFQKFNDHKDLGVTLEAHLAAGLPQEGFRESYTRHTKALVAVGNGAGTDRAFGLETEIIALSNPYTAPDAPMQVELHLRGVPLPDTQIELFERAPDGTVAVSLLRTDAAGRATFALRPGHAYLLDAVTLEPDPDPETAYRTLWAGLSFAVPG